MESLKLIDNNVQLSFSVYDYVRDETPALDPRIAVIVANQYTYDRKDPIPINSTDLDVRWDLFDGADEFGQDITAAGFGGSIEDPDNILSLKADQFQDRFETI